MSSGGEDLDEDELLQMALKEQSQRDHSYQKPNPSKPVRNYVQKPAKRGEGSTGSAAATRKTNSVQQQKRSVSPDEEDDSEVEMLSISSGDEDDRAYVAQKNRGRTAGNKSMKLRGKHEQESDMQDLVLSFSGLEEKVLAQYTLAKTNLIRTAAVNYLLDAGVEWAAAPTVKHCRASENAAVELLHTLVAVHAEVFAGCKPLLDKTLGILVEGLIDIFLGLLNENKSKDLKAFDTNGFCQLMLELEYFETVLNPYFTHDAREALKSLEGALLEKAAETVTESADTPSHQRRPTRGSDDMHSDDRQTISPDDLIALAHQYSLELLQAELERTRINIACFVESLPLDSVPESAKAAYTSFRGSMHSPSRNIS